MTDPPMTDPRMTAPRTTAQRPSAVDRLSARSGRRPTVVAAALAVALVVALGVAAWLVLSGREAQQRADAVAEATSVARERAVQLTSYTGETFDADTAWARTGATSRFAREYAEANEPVAEVARRVEARAAGDVVEAVGRAVSSDEVQVLLFVDQTVTRGSDGTRSTERSRVVMTMTRQEGAWLVDDVVLR